MNNFKITIALTARNGKIFKICIYKYFVTEFVKRKILGHMLVIPRLRATSLILMEIGCP
jgi:hypothetical protein